MKIQYHSDLHLEFNFKIAKIFEVSKEADVLVLAGDITNDPDQAVDFLQNIRQQTDIPILYVLGNHEYYKHGFDVEVEYIAKCQDIKNVYVLHRYRNMEAMPTVRIENVLFVGNTLYSDLSNPVNSLAVKRVINDFSQVKGMTINVWHKRYMENKNDIERAFINHKQLDLKTVVVTHFAPVRIVGDPAFYGDPVNDAFYSDLSELILYYEPNVWIFGHTHYNCEDQEIGKTRIVCNQYGYYFERPKFEIKLIEI